MTRQFVEPSTGARAHGIANGTKLNTPYRAKPTLLRCRGLDLLILVKIRLTYLGGRVTPKARDGSPGLEGRQNKKIFMSALL